MPEQRVNFLEPPDTRGGALRIRERWVLEDGRRAGLQTRCEEEERRAEELVGEVHLVFFGAAQTGYRPRV
eukprot:2366167-Lingulodinium_polyedra.AAC.1